MLLANAMSLCSDAEFDTVENTAIGEPTECALVNYAHSLNLDKNKEKNRFPRIGEIPFDSSRKMMTTVHKIGDDKIIETKQTPNSAQAIDSEINEILNNPDYSNAMAVNHNNLVDRMVELQQKKLALKG